MPPVPSAEQECWSIEDQDRPSLGTGSLSRSPGKRAGWSLTEVNSHRAWLGGVSPTHFFLDNAAPTPPPPGSPPGPPKQNRPSLPCFHSPNTGAASHRPPPPLLSVGGALLALAPHHCPVYPLFPHGAGNLLTQRRGVMSDLPTDDGTTPCRSRAPETCL